MEQNKQNTQESGSQQDKKAKEAEKNQPAGSQHQTGGSQHQGSAGQKQDGGAPAPSRPYYSPKQGEDEKDDDRQEQAEQN